MLIWHVYSIYTNEIFLILVQIQHESNSCEDSTGRRADPGLTLTRPALARPHGSRKGRVSGRSACKNTDQARSVVSENML